MEEKIVFSVNDIHYEISKWDNRVLISAYISDISEYKLWEKEINGALISKDNEKNANFRYTPNHIFTFFKKYSEKRENSSTL
jgi:hypothetical protein